MGAGRTRSKYHLGRLSATTKTDGHEGCCTRSGGYAIGLVSDAIRFLVMFVVGGAIVLGVAYALGFFLGAERP
jgi:hypothetical protein